ncbi:hypothetical protein [Serratia sp. 2723]|uniref:hypothetical protein n=1 Tax=unclassified Serratia (in: enterobacteria) TaxID=2647522 RepID=UPI003D1CC3C7
MTLNDKIQTSRALKGGHTRMALAWQWLYERCARLPVRKQKSTELQEHARVSTYCKRWTIWAFCILLVWGPTICKADRIVYVLSTSIPPNSVLPGGDFVSDFAIPSASCSGDCDVNPNAYLYLTADDNTAGTAVGASRGGAKWGVAVPGLSPTTYGISVPENGVYMVPVGGTITRQAESYVDFGGVNGWVTWSFTADFISNTPELVKLASVQKISGAMWEQAVGPHPDINNIQVKKGYIAFIGPDSTKLKDRAYYNTSKTLTTGSLISRLIAGPSAKPGVTKLTNLQLRDYRTTKSGSINKPTSIVTAGLTCTLGLGGADIILTSDAKPSSKSGDIVGKSTGQEMDLKVTCAHTNTSGIVLPIGFTLKPAGGGTVESNTKLMYKADQPSFYMLFTRDAKHTCNASDSSVIKLDGVTSTHITDIPVGQGLNATVIPLGATLCTSGTLGQKPGSYTMSVTASIVSY